MRALTYPTLSDNPSNSLLWFEYFYLAAILLAFFIAIDPFELGFRRNEIIKHLPLLISGVGIVFSFINGQLNYGSTVNFPPSILAVTWPLVLLALLIIGGSLYVRFVEHNRYTFMTVGLYMLMLYISAYFFTRTTAPNVMLRFYFGVMFIAAGIMAAYLIFYFKTRQVYHEQIFLLIPLAVFFIVAKMPKYLQFCGFCFFILMSYLSHKNTSYLIAVLVLIYLAVFVWAPRLKAKEGIYHYINKYLLLVFFVGLATSITFFVSYRDTYLPSGNPEYRLHAYQIVWEEFIQSPFWGSFFTSAAVKKFTLFDVGVSNNLLPTHSDLLDLIGQGGILALFIWAFGLYKISKLVYRKLLAPHLLHEAWAPYAHTLSVMSLAGIITYLFNPILLQPALSYLLWTNLGILLGMALYIHHDKEKNNVR